MRTFNRLFTAVVILVAVLILGGCQPMVVPTVAPTPGPSPEVEANRELAERYMEELWNEGNLEVADEILSEDFVSYAFPEGGREVLKQAVAGFHADLPGGSFATDEVIVTEDKIVIRGAAMAVPAGAPEGAEPERLDDWIATLSVEDGKITDRWIAFVPAPGPPAEGESSSESCTTDEEKIAAFKSAIDAVNAGDLDAVMDSYAEGAVVMSRHVPEFDASTGKVTVPVDERIGKGAIKDYVAGAMSVAVNIELSDVAVQGNRVTALGSVYTTYYRDAFDFPRLDMMFTATLEGCKVVSLEQEITSESIAELEQALSQK